MMDASTREAAHRAASDAELIAWVDEQDNLLGSLVRSDLRRRGLIGRCTFIFLFNSSGELCVHRRTLSKAMYPGFWDTAAGGMVAAHESYAESAARELEEELGLVIDPTQATFLGQFSAPAANEPGFVVQAEIFQLTIDAEVSPAAEIEEVVWVDPATDPVLELAPLTRDLILPFYRASLTRIA